MAGARGTQQGVRVKPSSIKQYSRQAEEQFRAIRTQLDKLVVAVATVDYEGVNAHHFKKTSGEMAAQFSNTLLQDMRGLADAVAAATSRIAASLGGDRVTIQFDGSKIVPPSVSQATEVSQADPSALEQLRDGTVKPAFQKVEDLLQQHKQALVTTDWYGNAKDGAVDAVTRFTKAAVALTDDNRRQLVDFITQQVAEVRQQDAF